MDDTLADLELKLLSLPDAQRARLLQRLLDSLDAGAAALDPGWISLAQQRLQQARAGTVLTQDHAQVMAAARQRLG